MANIYKKIKFFFRNFLFILSLSTPFSRVIVFSLGFILLFLLPTDKLHYLPIRSLYETILHVKPYSSGMTRAVSSILHGNLQQAWNFNPLAFLVVFIALFILIKDIIYLIRTKDFKL